MSNADQVEFRHEDEGFRKPDVIETICIEYAFVCPRCIKLRRLGKLPPGNALYTKVIDDLDGGVELDAGCNHVESYRFNEGSGNWEVKFKAEKKRKVAPCSV